MVRETGKRPGGEEPTGGRIFSPGSSPFSELNRCARAVLQPVLMRPGDKTIRPVGADGGSCRNSSVTEGKQSGKMKRICKSFRGKRKALA